MTLEQRYSGTARRVPAVPVKRTGEDKSKIGSCNKSLNQSFRIPDYDWFYGYRYRYSCPAATWITAGRQTKETTPT